MVVFSFRNQNFKNMLIKITVLKSGLVSRYPVEYSFRSKDSGIQTIRQGTCTSSFIQQIVIELLLVSSFILKVEKRIMNKILVLVGVIF